MNQTIDISPSPRVLRMLGQIDFKPWQCLAELIDNSIDSFITQKTQGLIIIDPRINIAIPSDVDIQRGRAELIIEDNGPGMSKEQLQQAVRAGYSGNDPVEKMGLFGMGFNISTARLGKKTTIWTTTIESDVWLGISIDFDQLEKNKTFHTPLLEKSKGPFELESKAHGTKISIEKLEKNRIKPLNWGLSKSNTKIKLGKIYGKIMDELNLTIIYAGDKIKPWKHCAWDSKRRVATKDFGDVPARLEINENLPTRKFCNTCWVWLAPTENSCPSCGMVENLIDRKRKIKGWIGIQRYFHQTHYGIDLIRNGRVIEELDKSMFSYEDSVGNKELEYPLDATHWGGRIIGELEIDFVRVSHQKDSFDKFDPEWEHVIELVRGNSPLRPHIAKSYGMAKNESPLAKLYAGYRSGYAGLKNLVPGNESGTGVNSGIIKEYYEKFYANDPEYQTDEKWYELVLLVEGVKNPSTTGSNSAGGVPPIFSPIPKPPTTTNGVQIEFPRPISTNKNPEPDGLLITNQELIKDHVLSRMYSLDIEGNKYSILVDAKYSNSNEQNLTTKFIASVQKVDFIYYPKHKIFAESLESPVDHFIIDLAQHFHILSTLSPKDFPVSRIVNLLKNQYFFDSVSDLNSTTSEAVSMLNEIKNLITETLPTKAPIELQRYNSEFISAVRSAAAIKGFGADDEIEQILIKGEIGEYIGYQHFSTIISLWPDLFFDGKFFYTNYNVINDISIKNNILDLIVSSINDLIWLVDEGRNQISKDKYWRIRFERSLASIKLLIGMRG